MPGSKDLFQAIREVGRAFGTTLETDELLDRIVRNAARTMDAKAASLYLEDKETDEIVCLSPQADFGGISMFYADFHQVGDEEVVDLLNHAADFLEEETPLPAP